MSFAGSVPALKHLLNSLLKLILDIELFARFCCFISSNDLKFSISPEFLFILLSENKSFLDLFLPKLCEKFDLLEISITSL